MNQLPYAFLFDMDGVICDNNDFHKTTWMEYARRLGKELTDEDIETKVYGKTNEDILRFTLGRDVTPEEVEHHAETKEALYRELYRPHFQLTPGLEAFLTEAKALGIRLGLATNAPPSNLAFSWEMGGLGRFFETSAHPGLVDRPKPAPDLYLYVARQLGVDPHRCLVFEDSLTGVAAGLAAGSQVVGIASTYPFSKLEQVAQRVTKDFTTITPAECQALIDRHPKHLQ